MAAKTATYEDIRNKYQPEIEKAKIEIVSPKIEIQNLNNLILKPGKFWTLYLKPSTL